MSEPSEPEPHDSMIDVINVYKKDVDRTLLRENLRLTVEERFRKFESFWEYAHELRGAAWRNGPAKDRNATKLS
jgi:hypothetical protein